MRTTYKAARDWMMSTFDWSEDLAITAITMGMSLLDLINFTGVQ